MLIAMHLIAKPDLTAKIVMARMELGQMRTSESTQQPRGHTYL